MDYSVAEQQMLASLEAVDGANWEYRTLYKRGVFDNIGYLSQSFWRKPKGAFEQ